MARLVRATHAHGRFDGEPLALGGPNSGLGVPGWPGQDRMSVWRRLASLHASARIARAGPAPCLKHGRRAVEEIITFVGLDVHKESIEVGLAWAGRDGEVRHYGRIEASPAAVERLLTRLGGAGRKLSVCYEAGPCGYGLYRQVRALGHDCAVVAPSLIPKRPGGRG